MGVPNAVLKTQNEVPDPGEGTPVLGILSVGKDRPHLPLDHGPLPSGQSIAEDRVEERRARQQPGDLDGLRVDQQARGGATNPCGPLLQDGLGDAHRRALLGERRVPWSGGV